MGKILRYGYEYDTPDYPEKFSFITYPGVATGKYKISTYGRVFNIKNKKIMKTFIDPDYHERITLSTDIKHPTKRGNKQKYYFIHRSMLWEFVGPPPDAEHNICNHKNGIPCCNFIHSLEWCSVLENTNHAKKLGLLNTIGTNSVKCKYDEKLIRKICSLFEAGYNNIEIVEMITGKKEYKGNNSGIYHLINKLGKRIGYRDIVQEYDYLPDKSFFQCNEEISKIREMIRDGKTNYDILREFNIYKISENRLFYNRIINERAKCEVLFNDYRKYNQ